MAGIGLERVELIDGEWSGLREPCGGIGDGYINSHKAIRDGNEIDPRKFMEDILNNSNVTITPYPVDPVHGAFVVFENGRPTMARKDPNKYWSSGRFSPGDLQDLHTERINPGTKFDEVHAGAEIELALIHLHGEPAHGAIGPNSPLYLNAQDRGLRPANELFSSVMETDLGHSASPFERIVQAVQQLRAISELARQYHLLVLPTDTLSFTPSREDFNENIYVQLMVDPDRNILSPDIVRFVGSTAQTHVDRVRTIESAAIAMNRYELLQSIISAASLAGPFVDGQLQPDMLEVHPNLQDQQLLPSSRPWLSETAEMVSGSRRWMLSGRNLSRYAVSDGGIFHTPLPETRDGMYQEAVAVMMPDSPLMQGSMPTPDRLRGHHANRYRWGEGVNGTIETSNLGTSGARIERLMALQELERVLLFKLQVEAESGTDTTLAERYPTLFNSVDEESLMNAHLNNIAVSIDGFDAYVVGADEKTYKAEELFVDILRYATEPTEEYDGRSLSTGMLQELVKSLEAPNFAEPEWDQYRDRFELISAKAYYSTGRGTLAHVMIARAQELRAIYGNNVPDTRIIDEVNLDVARAWSSYVQGLTEEEMSIFAQKV
jgi:hypothetical protein